MKVSIKDLLAKDDSALRELLGQNRTLEEFKEQLQAADKLKGKGRDKVEDELNRMMTPRVDEYSLKWAIEDAERAQKGGKEGLKNASPASVLD